MVERFLKSKYQISDKIGEGPFSLTYKGCLMGTDVPIIIKIYKRAALNSPLINKLRPKVMKMVNIDHPNIAKILDGDYGWQGYYFVREFVDGHSLSEILAEQSFDMSSAMQIGERLCETLKFAHDNNVIHGALGANNVFISSKKELKLVDFLLEGRVRSNINLIARQTALDARYLAPEQLKGSAATQQTDIYSFGVLFYQLLTGTLPFTGRDNLEIAIKQLKEEPVFPSSIDANIPHYLDEIVLKAMEKDPVARFKDFGEIQQSLAEKALIFKGADINLSNLIYNDMASLEAEEADVEEAPNRTSRQAGKKEKKIAVKKRSGIYMWILFVILAAIASGLWYSFIQGMLILR